MATSELDDFSAFAGSEHMFFGLADPYGFIRSEVEGALRKQVTDARLKSLVTRDKPKFLTLGRKSDDEHVIVSHFAFSVLAKLHVTFEGDQREETVEAALTFLFANIDRPGEERCRSHLDLHADAERRFDEETLRARFLAFRQATAVSHG